MSKIFCIGFHKTGTTTLAECLRHLGLRVCPEELSYLYRTEAPVQVFRFSSAKNSVSTHAKI